MKYPWLPVASCVVAVWSSTVVAETTTAPKAPKAPVAPKAPTVSNVAMPAAQRLPKSLQGVSALDTAKKLALATELARRLKVTAPKGLEQSLRLSARHLYEDGRADLTVECSTSVDPVSDFIVPQIYVSGGFGLPLPSLPKPKCETDRSQVTKIRVLPSKAGQAIMFDVIVESQPAFQGLGQVSVIEAVNSLTPNSKQSWEIGPGEAGHLTGIMMPPGLSWITLELHLLKGGIKIRSVELTPLQ